MDCAQYSDACCLDLVGTLYEISPDLGNWVSFLERLTETTSSAAAMVRSSNQETGEGRALSGAQLTPEQLAAYERSFHPAAVKLIGLGNPLFTEPGAVATLDMAVTRKRLSGSPLGEQLSSELVKHLLNAVIDVDGPMVFSLTLFRVSGQPAYVGAELDLLRRLLPHLARAAKVTRHLRFLDSVNAALTRSLDRLPVGVLLVDRSAKVLASNLTARQLLEHRDGVHTDRQGRLRGQHPAASRQIRETLREVLDAAERGPAATVASAPAAVVALDRRGSRPLLLAAAPVGGVQSSMLQSEPCAALFLSDPERPISLAEPTLQGLWGLTPAEARVAQLVQRGHDVPQIAQKLDVRPSTVRTHLNRIFDKTGTRRQPELASLLSWSTSALAQLQATG